jgi:cytoskeletal protein RodZ
VAGYSAYRIFEETIRVDSSAHFLGLRLNFFIAIVGTVSGLTWFAFTQRRGKRPEPSPPEAESSSASEPAPAESSSAESSSAESSPAES